MAKSESEKIEVITINLPNPAPKPVEYFEVQGTDLDGNPVIRRYPLLNGVTEKAPLRTAEIAEEL